MSPPPLPVSVVLTKRQEARAWHYPFPQTSSFALCQYLHGNASTNVAPSCSFGWVHNSNHSKQNQRQNCNVFVASCLLSAKERNHVELKRLANAKKKSPLLPQTPGKGI